MKKILLFIVAAMLYVFSIAQNTQPTAGMQLQQIGSPNTMSRTNGVQYGVVGLLLADYNDTATANLNSYIRLMPGLIIRTGNRYWIRNTAATGWNELANASGVGTVTSFSSGNLSPLFTTSVANASTTPALSFSLVSQSQNLVYASPNGSSGVPSFRALATADLPELNLVAWKTTGNLGTTAGTNFIGTTDAQDVVVKRNSAVAGTFGFNSTLGVTELATNSITSLYGRFQSLRVDRGSSPTTQYGTFDPSTLTTARSWILPNASGTIALTSDIPGSIVTGTGTTNFLARWTSSTAIGDGVTQDNGTNVGIGVAPSSLIKFAVVRDIVGAEAASIEASDFSMTSGAGDNTTHMFPIHARATITGGDVSTEVAGVSSIVQQSGGTSAVDEGFGTVITFTGGTVSSEIRAYENRTTISANLAGSVIGSRNSISQTTGTISGDYSTFRSQITQSASTNVLGSTNGYYGLMSLAGSNAVVKGHEYTIGISAGTNPSILGSDIIMNLSGGTNGTTFGQRINLNLTGGTVGAATGLQVLGPNALSTDPTVANFQSRMATSYGVYISAHASQSQDLFDVVNSSSSKLFSISGTGNVGLATASATVATIGGGATASELRFLEPSASGTNYSAFKAVAQGSNITYSLPPTVGGAGTFLRDAAGNGVLDWSTPSAPAPSLTTNQVGFGIAGVLGSSANLYFDGSFLQVTGGAKVGIDGTYSGGLLDVGSNAGVVVVGTPVDGNATFINLDDGAQTVTVSTLAGTGTRAVLADATGILTAPISDRVVKYSINNLDYGLSTIMKLKPVSFYYKKQWQNYGTLRQVGFIAQDVEKVMPNSVFTTPKTGLKGINSYDIIPVLVKALQEQQKQIDTLKKEVSKLKNKK